MAKLDPKKLKEVTERLNEIRDAGTEASFAFADMSKNLGQIAKNSGDLRESIIASGKAAKGLVKEANELAQFTKADLSDKKEAAKFEKHAAALAKKRTEIESKIRVLNVLKLNSSEQEAKNLQKTINILQDGVDRSKMISEEYDNINKANKELNSNTKWMDKMEETLKTIPGIGPLIAGPFKKASEAMRVARVKNEGFFKSSLKGAYELSKVFGPTMLLGLLIKAADHTVEIQRSMEMSTHEAHKLEKRFNKIAINSGESTLHQDNLLEALQGISKEMGVVRGISDDQIKNQVFLTKKMGLSEKSAAKFAKYQTATGKSAKETNKEIESATKKLAKETGIVFNLSEIFEEVPPSYPSIWCYYLILC